MRLWGNVAEGGDMQSVYCAAIGRARTLGAKAEGRAIQFPQRRIGSSRSSLRNSKERFCPIAVFLGASPGPAALLGLGETLLSVR